MDEKKLADLDSILNAAAARRRPAYDYSGMSTKQFVFNWIYVHTVVHFLAWATAIWGARIRRIQLSPEKYEEVLSLADFPLTRQSVSELARWYFERPIFGLLAEALHEQPHIIAELRKRLKGHDIAADLFIMPSSTGLGVDLGRVEKLLNIDEVSSFPDYDELRAAALLKTVEKIAEKRRSIAPPLPPFPLPLPAIIQQIWQTEMSELWRHEYETKLAYVVAGLETSDGVLTRNINVRTPHDTEERRGRRHRAILRKRTSDTGQESPLEKPIDNRKAKEDLVSIARAQWGEKPAEAVGYVILESKSEKEAALLTGVPYQSVRRYLSKLHKLASQPK